MAKLPTAIDVTGAVAPRQMPGVRVPAGAFGEDIGKAASELGAYLENEATVQLDLDNKAEAQELSNELNTRMRALEIGDGDQETGYRNALGKAAMDSRGDYEQRAEDLRKELMARATNDTVRRTFGAVAANRTGRFYDTVGTHFNAQRLAFRETAFKNTNNVATDNAVNATTDEERVAHADDAFTNTWMYYSEQKGLSDKIARTFAEEARSAVHKSVILGLVDNQPTAARKYYEKIQGQIDSGDKPALAKALRGGYVKEESARLAANPDAQTGTLAERVKWAKTQSTKDIEVQDALVQRISADFRVEETARKERIRTMREEAFNMIETGKDADGNPKVIKDISDLPVELIATLPGNDLTALTNYIKNKAKRGSGFSLSSDFNTTSAIDDVIIGEDDEEFVNYDLNSVRTKLTQTDFRRYRALQIAAKKRIANEEAKDPSYTLANKELKLAFDAYGIKTTASATKKQKRLRTLVTRNVYDLVEDAKAEGRKLTRDEINRQIVTDLLVVNPPGMSNQGRRVMADLTTDYEISDADEAEVQEQIATASKVPLREVQEIVRVLRKEGTKVTLDLVQRLYQAKIDAEGF